MRRGRRSGQIVKSLDALPSWFTLDKYAVAEHFSLEQWFNAFYVRQTVWQLFKYRATTGIYVTYWDEIQRAGAAAFTDRAGLAARIGSDAVQSLTVVDLFEIRDSIGAEGSYEKHYKKFGRELEKSKVGEGVSPHKKLQETIRVALNPDTYWMHNAAFIVLDLTATNETLEASFKSWLQQIREEEQDRFRTRRYSAKDMKAWFESGVLQFLDLNHWAATQRTRIPDWLMGEAIFPASRAINVSEAVRKTTRLLAQRVIAHSALVESLATDINAAKEGVTNKKPEGQ